jgi:hypothetical protein
MTDEKFTFIEDLRDKKRTATGAHHKRTHCGKGGAVKFPSDFMTKKELRAMNGEVKSYKLNEPMTWAEFKAMPDDIKVTYIKALRGKYNVSDSKIFEMMGVAQAVGQREIARLGIGIGRGMRNGKAKWDVEGWCAFVNGVPKIEKCVADSEKPVEECEPVPADLKFAKMEYTEPKCEPTTMVAPRCGTMCFEGNARLALATVGWMLDDANVHLSVTWEVRHEEKACES